jgi:flavin reductase (DIM6/NTAB) family NADH-FMN oxidoreductase RutF
VLSGSANSVFVWLVNAHFLPVELSKAYRLINHGPTVLVSSAHAGVENVMAASWSCGLDTVPPKVTLVVDSETKTRELIDGSGEFVLQVPTAGQVAMTLAVGSLSLDDDPAKLSKCGVELFRVDGITVPFVVGCAAWLHCKVVAEPHVQSAYDLFIGEVVGAWADDRIFRNGHWHYETAGPEWRSLHYIAGGHFYAIGEPVRIDPT